MIHELEPRVSGAGRIDSYIELHVGGSRSALATGIISSSTRMSFFRARATRTPRAVSASTSPAKSRLAGINCGFLLQAVSATFGNKLVGINHGVGLTREAKTDPYADGLSKGFASMVISFALGRQELRLDRYAFSELPQLGRSALQSPCTFSTRLIGWCRISRPSFMTNASS